MLVLDAMDCLPLIVGGSNFETWFRGMSTNGIQRQLYCFFDSERLRCIVICRGRRQRLFAAAGRTLGH